MISPCAFERKKIVDEIFKAQKKGIDLLELDSKDEDALQKALEHLNTTSLFAETAAVFLNGAEGFVKKDKENLTHYLKNPLLSSLLILGSSTAKGLQDLYAAGKKEMVVCDLSAEKPWEKRKRLEKMLVSHASSLGKALRLELALFLIDQVGADLSLLIQEVHKLAAFTGERTEISKQDIETISCHGTSGVTWEWIDELVLSELKVERKEIGDSEFFILLGQLRYKLQQALEISVCMHQNMSFDEIQERFPSFQRTRLEKIAPVLKKRGWHYFERALQLLFETEILAKNSTLEPSLLLDLWTHKKNQR